MLGGKQPCFVQGDVLPYFILHLSICLMILPASSFGVMAAQALSADGQCAQWQDLHLSAENPFDDISDSLVDLQRTVEAVIQGLTEVVKNEIEMDKRSKTNAAIGSAARVASGSLTVAAAFQPAVGIPMAIGATGGAMTGDYFLNKATNDEGEAAAKFQAEALKFITLHNKKVVKTRCLLGQYYGSTSETLGLRQKIKTFRRNLGLIEVTFTHHVTYSTNHYSKATGVTMGVLTTVMKNGNEAGKFHQIVAQGSGVHNFVRGTAMIGGACAVAHGLSELVNIYRSWGHPPLYAKEIEFVVKQLGRNERAIEELLRAIP